jgi:hypothetical protein
MAAAPCHCTRATCLVPAQALADNRTAKKDLVAAEEHIKDLQRQLAASDKQAAKGCRCIIS